MFLVCVRIMGMFAILIAPFLSSSVVHTILGVVLTMFNPLGLNLLSKFIIGITSRRDYDKATSLDSVIGKLICVCRQEAQIIVQPANIIIKPVHICFVLAL